MLKQLIISVMAFACTLSVQPINANVCDGPGIPITQVPTGSTGQGHPKCPTNHLYIYQDGYIITLPLLDYDVTLCLLDSNDDVVYSTYVPAGTTLVYLPTTLSGEFEIRLVTSSFYFYGYITL